MEKDTEFGNKIIRALHTLGPVKHEALWIMADDLCRDISTLKSCLLTKKPEFCMVHLDEMQETAYKLRNHLKRETLAPTE